MILFFPQWQGAGRGHRLDRPARVLLEKITAAHEGEIVEIPVDTDDDLILEDGIWAKRVVLKQLSDARDLLQSRAPQTVFTLGGDCAIEVAPVAYLNARTDNFALVWIDAHPDLNTTETSPSATFHGMPLRVLMGEGDPEFTALVSKPLTPDKVLFVGVRNLDPGELEFIDRHSLTNFPVNTPNIAARLVEELKKREIEHIYVHVDLDVLDPAQWPYMCYPEPDGFSVAALAEIVSALGAAFNVVGMSITEYDSIEGSGLDTLAPLLGSFIDFATLQDHHA